MNATTHPSPPEEAVPEPVAESDPEFRLTELPKELGVLLISIGVLGVVLPGVVGTPAIVAGGIVLWPSRFQRVDDWLKRKAPNVHRRSMKQIARLISDMEKRYPGKG